MTRQGEGTDQQGRFQAVLFDRDATLIRDVPYNADPASVDPMPGASTALDRLRRAGLRLGVVSNQSGIGRGLVDAAAVAAVNHRVDAVLGPFDTWQVCPHAPGDGCRCRKPAPGMVLAAARDLGVEPYRCVLVGDIGADLAAAAAAGATGLLVPTPVTRPEEIIGAAAAVTGLPEAADWILARQRLAVAPAAPPGRHVLAVRADSAGDVLLCGAAVRAIAARAGRLSLLCGPRGRAAAELLPGVDEIIEWAVPWIAPDARGLDPDHLRAIVGRLSTLEIDEAVVFTSFHQSPLPMALLLRMAGVRRIAAISDDYPGALLDVRHRVPAGVPEPERALSLAAAAGYPPAGGDGARLRVKLPPPGHGTRNSGSSHPADQRRTGYVVVHPGASVPARACPPATSARIVEALARTGRRVLVTGDRAERDLTAAVAGRHGVDLGGRTDLAGLARLIASADCLVTGNTGPAHLAAAVGTPVVSLFAPTVPFGQWAPYGVPVVRLGDQAAPCRDSRATECPVPGHPCLSGIDPADVVAAVRVLTGTAGTVAGGRAPVARPDRGAAARTTTAARGRLRPLRSPAASVDGGTAPAPGGQSR